MHTTLIGVFVNPREAQAAYWNLASAGIDRGDIRLRRERTAPIPQGPRRGGALQRVLGRVSHWLEQPFGAAQDQATGNHRGQGSRQRHKTRGKHRAKQCG